MKKIYSLKDKRLIQKIIHFSIKNKKQIMSNSYIIHYAKNDLGTSRFCFAISKKGKTAPERNKIKRQLREMVGNSLNYSYDFVIITRLNYLDHKFSKNKLELERQLLKAQGGEHLNGSSTTKDNNN